MTKPITDNILPRDSGHPNEQIQMARANIARFNDQLLAQENQPGEDQTHSDNASPLEQYEWVDRGIKDVRMEDLPPPEDIHGPDDFKKVSSVEMQSGIQRLQEMRPAIEQGAGNTSDYWYTVDQQRGLSYEQGYQRIYDAFYGHDAIKLERDGDTYSITNGRHRIWLAKRMGIESLPARVVERQPQ